MLVLVCVCVCPGAGQYLVREGLALAVRELGFHEGVAEECRHVVVLSRDKSQDNRLSSLGWKNKWSASSLTLKLTMR